MTKFIKKHSGWEILERHGRFQGRKLGARGKVMWADDLPTLEYAIDDVGDL